ncbi:MULTISPECIES: autotransporter outer membrane beta-barrel domain-containing protein [Pacificibacter]|uniref:autotransporter outer membrane beta-barrel domain-containing protein n=1 Tax=Pacificibacter TaxID=1042323 RepID=UPI001C095511|nr:MULTISPECIES: autotransporter outer membrane beta-barrel domain-containing protein [Pacificibacter]MBU2937754.1 autotransporter outer membrane beta-barrel domain-containing protein [Pacificibacter marinus]MDO6617397.1 autotransporter outer membrane beta-barrel domain-containing protein [Pacificibacter sp. 1_MG-2023]
MRATFLCSLSSLALISVLALPLQAQAIEACTPSSPSDGDDVICSGTGTGLLDDGFDDGTITVSEGAVITGDDQGFEFDDGVTFTNAGTITGQNDHGVQGDNDVTVTNYGTVTGEDGDGVNIDDDGVIENYGTIIGSDDGVQLEDNARVINYDTGVIEAEDEGVNINTDGAVLINYGTITAGDDAVNAAADADITNYGTIRSTGDQDGIDLDSGMIFNAGLIISDGAEDGIDFDPSTGASTITNTGRIEGSIGINTDPIDTGAQTVINFGTIVGRSGTAISLGDGDDALEIHGGTIVGDVDLGAGTDTLTVVTTNFGAISFVNAPEVIDLQTDSALFVNQTLVMADAEVFGVADTLVAGLSYDITRTGFGPLKPGAFWISGQAQLGEDDWRDGALSFGRDFDTYGLFMSVAGGNAETGDITARNIAFGGRYARELSAQTQMSAVAFVGAGDVTYGDAGDATTDAMFAGLGVQLSHAMASRFTVSGNAGLSFYRLDDFSAENLEGAAFDARTVTNGFAGLEVGYDIAVSGLHLAPFVGVTALFVDGDAVAMSLADASTSFATSSEDSIGYLSLGMDLKGADIWSARVEARVDNDGEVSAVLSARTSF